MLVPATVVGPIAFPYSAAPWRADSPVRLGARRVRVRVCTRSFKEPALALIYFMDEAGARLLYLAFVAASASVAAYITVPSSRSSRRRLG